MLLSLHCFVFCDSKRKVRCVTYLLIDPPCLVSVSVNVTSGGFRGAHPARAPPYGPKFSLFHAVFWKIWQNHILAPPPRVGAPSYRESWIRPWWQCERTVSYVSIVHLILATSSPVKLTSGGRSKFFHFHAIFSPKNRLAHPIGAPRKFLDPPLLTVRLIIYLQRCLCLSSESTKTLRSSLGLNSFIKKLFHFHVVFGKFLPNTMLPHPPLRLAPPPPRKSRIRHWLVDWQERNDIYAVAFGGHLFYDLFLRGGGGGGAWIHYWVQMYWSFEILLFRHCYQVNRL